MEEDIERLISKKHQVKKSKISIKCARGSARETEGCVFFERGFGYKRHKVDKKDTS